MDKARGLNMSNFPDDIHNYDKHPSSPYYEEREEMDPYREEDSYREKREDDYLREKDYENGFGR